MTDANGRTPDRPVLVLGLGNTLLTDDGAGVELVRVLRRTTVLGRDPRFELVDGGTQGVALAGLFEDRPGVLLLDAEERGAPPGTIHVSNAVQLAERARGGTAHEGNAAELLAVVRLLGTCTGPVLLLGIEPQAVRTGLGLTPAVARALPRARRAAVEVLRNLVAGAARPGEVVPCTS